MPWYAYLLLFLSGLLLANGVPHFVQGISGAPFQSPRTLWSPRHKATSSAKSVRRSPGVVGRAGAFGADDPVVALGFDVQHRHLAPSLRGPVRCAIRNPPRPLRVLSAGFS